MNGLSVQIVTKNRISLFRSLSTDEGRRSGQWIEAKGRYKNFILCEGQRI